MEVVATLDAVLSARLAAYVTEQCGDSYTPASVQTKTETAVVLRCQNEADPAMLLGETLSWLLVNKPPHSTAALALHTQYADACGPLGNPVRLPGIGTGVVAPVRADGGQTIGGAEANPRACVDIYHLHCHFNGNPGSAEAAEALLVGAKAAVVAACEAPLHHHVWHEKNGTWPF
jgi:hypothetical protein